jgi:hypothetical protein
VVSDTNFDIAQFSAATPAEVGLTGIAHPFSSHVTTQERAPFCIYPVE